MCSSPEVSSPSPNGTSPWVASAMRPQEFSRGCRTRHSDTFIDLNRFGWPGAVLAWLTAVRPSPSSFSERDHVKSVSLVELDSAGKAQVDQIPTPVPRPLRQVEGRLAELLGRADTDLAELANAWVKVVLTDPDRPESPMERLREVWPHNRA